MHFTSSQCPTSLVSVHGIQRRKKGSLQCPEGEIKFPVSRQKGLYRRGCSIVLHVKVYPPHLAISTAAELHQGFKAAIWVLNLLGAPYVESRIFPPVYNRCRFRYAAVLSQVCFFTDKVLNLTNLISWINVLCRAIHL